jgi:hypothetical protein
MNNLSRFDRRIGRAKVVRPAASLKEKPYRFNWNSPIHISPHDSNVIYCGGQYLFRTEDRGMSWLIISPDLTTDDPEKQKDSGGPITPDNSGAEIHCTITTIAESPLKKGLIWCGTDDGNVQITQDNGKTWTNIIKNIKGLRPNTWCSRIEASHFEAGTAYTAFDGHRTDDYVPYVFMTTDYGRTWKSVAGNLPFGWIHVVREDLKNKNLLFAGTEFGIFASLDRGATWFSLKNNLPTVAVHDIAIHPRDNDLIIGTHGRGVWILDDIAFLQEMTPEILAKDFHLFSVRSATAFLQSTKGETYSRPVFAGKNPPYGMTFTAFFKSEPKEQPKLTITGAQGKTFYELKVPTKAGLFRETWNLMYAPEKDGKKLTSSPMTAAFPMVPPGDYTLALEVIGQKIEKSLKINADPRAEFKEEDREAQVRSLTRVLVVSQKMGLAVTAVKNIGRQFAKLDEDIKKTANVPESLSKAIIDFKEKEKELEDEIVPKDVQSLTSRELALRGGTLNLMVMTIGSAIIGYPSAPTQAELQTLKEIEDAVESQVNRLNDLIKTDLPKLNDLLKLNSVPALTVPQEVKF